MNNFDEEISTHTNKPGVRSRIIQSHSTAVEEPSNNSLTSPKAPLKLSECVETFQKSSVNLKHRRMTTWTLHPPASTRR
jgi:hypothetical protein